MRRVFRGAFLASSLSEALNASSLNRQDKALVTDLTYGTLRNLRLIDASLEDKLAKPEKLPEDVLNCLRLGSYELLFRGTARHAALNEWVEVSKPNHKKLAGLVNAVLRRVSLPESLNAALRYSIPDWLFKDWNKLFGDEAKTIAEGMNQAEPLWLYAYKANAQEILEAEDVKVEAGPVVQTLAVQSQKPLHQLNAFKDGLVGAQNPSSSLIAALLDIKSGDEVLDLASGNGIKTAQLSSLGATVTSIELNAKKVKRAEANLARLGYSAKHIVQNLETLPLNVEPSNKVLLDAPCSGTGTLRGHPEIKLRLEPKDVEELAHLQSKLLETAWQLTKPGGTLIYAICALTSTESTGVIEMFLQKHVDAKVSQVALAIPNMETPYGTFILPLAGLDGFFFCKLNKLS